MIIFPKKSVFYEKSVFLRKNLTKYGIFKITVFLTFLQLMNDCANHGIPLTVALGPCRLINDFLLFECPVDAHGPFTLTHGRPLSVDPSI